MRARFLALLPALVLTAACDDTGTGTVCPGIPVPAVRVVVVDSATSVDLGRSATGWWVVGERRGVLEKNFLQAEIDLLAYGPAGRYSIIVQQEGYLTWGRNDVRVRDGECGPQTVTLR
ncbi:MAG TPA: hypothetical protein VF142_22270, partial [Longimicrobium sp.]